jgi:nitroreductase
MDLLSLARNRVSIRSYKKDLKPSMDDLLYCIEVANEAPSGLNCQPWYFIIVSSHEVKHNIRKICEEGEKVFHNKVSGYFKKWLVDRGIKWVKPFLTDAPYLIVIISDTECPYSTQSTWLAIGYLLLALEEKGLSTLTYTPPKSRELKKLLNIPDNYRLEAIIPV